MHTKAYPIALHSIRANFESTVIIRAYLVNNYIFSVAHNKKYWHGIWQGEINQTMFLKND